METDAEVYGFRDCKAKYESNAMLQKSEGSLWQMQEARYDALETKMIEGIESLLDMIRQAFVRLFVRFYIAFGFG